MKKIIAVIAVLTLLYSCKKTETVEIEKVVEKTVEVPSNPFKIVASDMVTNGTVQTNNYSAIITRMKTFATSEGKDNYGYYIYYGNKNFDSNVDQVIGNSSTMFILCVTDWNVITVYNLGATATEASTNRSVIRSSTSRPNLLPTNQNFYSNKLCGFITKSDLLALN